tara:strand:- start:4696 stop:9123 length:4428 start_codon:yes stop_codon:yes gene_type:complete
MNKGVDERLVPNGEYIDALNVRLGSTEQSEIGSVENSKGNTQLTTLEFDGNALSSNARCIGAFEDGTRETIYWFIHDRSFSSGAINKLDLIVSLNVKEDILTYHVVSERDGSTSNTTLNFNPTYLITGIDMVEDFLFFTDDYNAPRFIDINKNYAEPSGGVDQFTAEELLVIKKPPLTAPTLTLSDTGGDENYVKDRFLCFAYRYRYENNQYSATSPFSKPAFASGPFDYSDASQLNEGMQNINNEINVTYNSGGPLVKGIDLIFKESESNVIKVARKFDKTDEGFADNTDYTFVFNSNQIFTVLPDSELLRLFDNVPRFAQAQTVMGNRLVYGNYVEGYNLRDKNNNALRLDFDADLISESVSVVTLSAVASSHEFTFDGSVTTNSLLSVNLQGLELTRGSEISISFTLIHATFSNSASPTTVPTEQSVSTPVSFTYQLQKDFASVNDLATDQDFIDKVGTALPGGTILPVYDPTNPTSCSGITFTDSYNCNITNVLDSALATTWTKYVSGRTSAITPPGTQNNGEGILIGSSVGNSSITFTVLAMRRVTDIANPNDPATDSAYEYFDISSPNALFKSSSSSLSLHSNRNYEIGIIYMDDFGRASTALVSEFNSVYTPCGVSALKNRIKVTIPTYQLAPSFATRYKFCIKPDLEGYQTIYADRFYLDAESDFAYIKLEGENAQKVEEDARLIVKRDSDGFVSNCRSVKVLEKKAHGSGFITTSSGATPPAGVYMKVLPTDFSVDATLETTFPKTTPTFYQVEGGNFGAIPINVYNGLSGGTGNTSGVPPLTGPFPSDADIPVGSTISFLMQITRNSDGPNGSVQTIDALFSQNFTATESYPTIIDWFTDNSINLIVNANIINQGQASISSFNYVGVVNSTANNYSLDSQPVGSFVWFLDLGTFEIRFVFKGAESFGVPLGGSSGKSYVSVIWFIRRNANFLVFETEPSDALADVWYESSESYAIDQATGFHTGNVQNQSAVNEGVVNTDFGNCYSFGNGVESYRVRDSLKGKEFGMGERVFSTSAEDYKEADRFAALTYSGVFNTETNVNKLNEFNLGILNFKNLEESFGPIQIISGRETDILTLQEDKISYVQEGKNLLSDAAGGSAVTSVPEVLGTQIARVEQYGISSNPESFVQYGYDKFFTDAKRGALIQLRGSGQNEQLTVLSEFGMRSWFRDLFLGGFDTQKLGAFDPYMNEFVLSSNTKKLPTEPVVVNCGVQRRLTVTAASPVSFTVNVGDTVGTCEISYNIISFANAGSITIAEDYTGTSTNINTTGAGTFNFTKNSVADEDVVITLTPASLGGKETVVLDITVGCPQAQQITLIEVCVSRDAQVGDTIHNQYQWTEGSTFVSPLHSKRVRLALGDGDAATEEVSDYTVITAPQGGGIIPNNGAVLSIISNKRLSDSFSFSATNRLMFLRSPLLYNNTPADITALLAAATPLPLTGFTPKVTGTVTLPAVGTDQYMYIIYDYFTI